MRIKIKFVFWTLMIMVISNGFKAQTISTSGHYHQGKVLEGLSMRSQLAHSNIYYSVYLPPDYGVSLRSYRVVYIYNIYFFKVYNQIKTYLQ